MMKMIQTILAHLRARKITHGRNYRSTMLTLKENL